MCGIAGFIKTSRSPWTLRTLHFMAEVQRHRGPDGEGYLLWNKATGTSIVRRGATVSWDEEGQPFEVALAHRRLAVIDLSDHALCPMTNEDESCWVTYNGEIYNFRELRADLEKRGHRFRSRSDTEVILHLYEERGEACVEELDGIFAFALWDAKQKRLLLARDRYGVKPLYYSDLPEGFAFASEVKAFLPLAGLPRDLDHEALAEHFTFQYTLGDKTLLKAVRLLEPGAVMTWNDGRLARRRYWDFVYEGDSSLTLSEAASGLRERFEASVQRQLVSDVPLGTYLSGGMDTGSIAAVAKRFIPDMHTFTCGFEVDGVTEEERFFDERSHARDLATYLGTEHHELLLGPSTMKSVIPQVAWHLDGPHVGISYQVYCTAEVIGRYVTVVLSGVGGDELFAGYPWRYEPIRELADPAAFPNRYYRLWVRFFDDEAKQKLFTPPIARAMKGYDTGEAFTEVLRPTNGWDPLHRALYFDAKTFLQGLFLVEDKLSMAHSVESRVPFTGNEIVDYVLRLPAAFKLQKGRSKVVLKAAMSGLLPDAVFSLPKVGFTPPEETWYRTTSAQYVRGLLLGTRARERGIFDSVTLEHILSDHLSGRANHRQLIWSLMVFEWWSRVFLDGDPPPSLPKGKSRRDD